MISPGVMIGFARRFEGASVMVVSPSRSNLSSSSSDSWSWRGMGAAGAGGRMEIGIIDLRRSLLDGGPSVRRESQQRVF